MTGSASPTAVEPSNAEIKALLESHMRASQDARSEQAKQWAELHATVKHQATQLAELHHRVQKVEGQARRALDSQAELEGSLLREVGALASNDKAQNAKLLTIESETRAQSVMLTELAGDKKTIVTSLGVVKRLVVGVTIAAPALWELAHWVVEHVRF